MKRSERPELPRVISSRTREVISRTVESLVSRGVETCAFMTVTFPKEITGYAARYAALVNFRKAVGRIKGAVAVWVPERHASGEYHFHVLLSVPGRDFSRGFRFDWLETWRAYKVSRNLRWMDTASPDLRWLWKLRNNTISGLGHIDIVPLRPSTKPIALGRYMTKYLTKGEHPKGLRLYRVTGYPPGQRPMTATVSLAKLGHSVEKRAVSAFSLVGSRARIFGKLKVRGDDGDRTKGWALRAALRGVEGLVGCRYLNWTENGEETVSVWAGMIILSVEQRSWACAFSYDVVQ